MFDSENSLRKLATVIDCEHKTAPTIGAGIPVIRTPDIGRGRLNTESARKISEKTYAQWTRRGIPVRGDLIMAREAPVGNVGIVGDERVCLGQRTVLIQPDREKVFPEYLNYVLSTDAMHAYMNMLATGATVGHLNVGDIRKLALPEFPKISEQKKIAAILAAYDDLIENNRQRIALLEKMAEEIYREWFVRLRFPDHEQTPVNKGVPEGWRIANLKSLCTQIRDSIKKQEFDEARRYVGLEHVPRKTMTQHDFEEVYLIESNKFVFQSGDILFSKIRPYLHKVSLASFSGVCSTDAIVLRPNEAHYSSFVHMTVFSEAFVDLATTASKGTKMPRADWDFLEKAPLLVPSETLLKNYADKSAPIFNKTANLTQQNEQLTQTRALLLNRLISGKLRVDDLDIQFPPSMRGDNSSKTSVSSAP